ncbi:hypothetical protein BAUCODRAFT_28923 [Baudoinia panamericana UAMH 10762]|uniref:Cysteine dioxygenase n=1 Tax=Baudoinia panamericana (strain UAMH 10762) TaxID=717646 RepID=M2NMZ3_BAUPA|nr:uncharacterized protein BAUCODRAFT_28923 [Baudoinia panamericana UAMH 10762]EMD00576.1 hypothetical protein BAUCODRAFT_28923 [Baudoinia panamericana UAMH 10762]
MMATDNATTIAGSVESETSSRHDSARPSLDQRNSFAALINGINAILGSSDGIDSVRVDITELKDVMRAYVGPDCEWARYAFADDTRNYTRNLVDNCNGKSNLLILVWTPGKASPIHDHADAHCVMKVLKGSLTETVYGWPCELHESEALCSVSQSLIVPSTHHTCSARAEILQPHALQVKRQTTLEQGEVTYMSDQLGLHRVRNASKSDVAVSLHLYTPPNAANHGCHIFDERTGSKSRVEQCHFYSEFGVRK